MKPDNGGSPPRDSIKIKIMEVIRGNLFHMWDKDRVVVDEFNINSMTVRIHKKGNPITPLNYYLNYTTPTNTYTISLGLGV